LFAPGLRTWVESPTWLGSYIALLAGAGVFGVGALLRYARTALDREERSRTTWVLAALIAGAGLGSTDLLNDVGVPLPSLGAPGTLLAALMLGFAIFRHRLLDRDDTVARGVLYVAIAVFGVVAYLAVLGWLGADLAPLALATVVLTLVFAFLVRRVTMAFAEGRAERERLTLLGRMSDQLAHDVKNPLAAMRGAVQFLQEERRRGRPLEPHGSMLDLLEAQVERLAAIADRYRHLAQAEPSRSRCDLNGIIEASVRAASQNGRSTELHLARDLPLAQLDEALIASCLENLLANAADATEGGGSIRIRSEAAGSSLAVTIEDTGSGMDGRTLNRAFDDFFTTKAQGTGLGLGFVRRVVRAHGGTVRVKSEPGRGTKVVLHLPRETNQGH
jgi:signal transduction histidine kinase